MSDLKAEELAAIREAKRYYAQTQMIEMPDTHFAAQCGACGYVDGEDFNALLAAYDEMVKERDQWRENCLTRKQMYYAMRAARREAVDKVSALAERLKACEADAAEMRDLLQEAYDYGTLWRGNRIYKHIKSDAALSPSPKAEKEAEKECEFCNRSTSEERIGGFCCRKAEKAFYSPSATEK